MAFSGGVFSRIYNWVSDANSNIPITASRMDSEMDGMATGLSTCVLKDGTQVITADLPMAGFKHTGVGNATARTHYGVVGQIQDGGYIWGGTSGGTTTAYTISTTPVTTALTAGQVFSFIINATNTAAATLAVNGLTATAIKKNLGAGLVATVVGDLPINNVATCRYDGTQFVLLNVMPFSHGADIASATGAGTLNLDTATGDLVDVTGTTGISAVTLSEGRCCTVRFTGALTLTNGASLVLPGAANITTVAGDYAIFRGYASGVVRCVHYSRLAGTPLVSSLSSKVGTFTRDATTASGSQAVTGVGFTPRALIIFATISTTKPASWAFCDSTTTSYQMLINDGGTAGQMFSQTGIAYITVSAGNLQTAVVASLDADGFTLTWTKTGSPTGTMTMNYLALK